MTEKKNATHTPGPWKLRSQGNNGYDIDAPTWSSLGIVIAGEIGGAEGEANARLISASPGLLAYAECSAAIDCARCDPAYDPQLVLRGHGWNGQENPGVFLSRIRRDAIEAATGSYLGRAA